MKISDFFDKQYIDFAVYDSYRSLGNFCDGLKPSARKILFSAKKRPLSKKAEKVSIFVSDVSRETEYLHGSVSLEGVLVGMAQNFTGANNINLMLPEGSFGNRTIQSSAASRYIFTKRNPIVDILIPEIDSNILVEQEFEGTKIEPKFYVPIIPMILVNGSEGIGNGFAQKIFSRDPIQIIDLLSNRILKQKSPTNIQLYFKGFRGKINRIENNSWEIIGSFERVGQAVLNVTELPVGYDLEKYVSILNRLEEDKIISDYTDKSEENKFLFEIKVTREFLKKDDRWILEKLKLIRRVTENFTCIGENNEISEFSNEVDVFNAFFDVRYRYYQKRKDWLISKIKQELMILGSKYFFVKLILDEQIKVFKETKKSVEDQLLKRTEFDFSKLESLNFLLNMPIHSFTKETFNELKQQIQNKKEELKEVQETTIEQSWLKELETLKKELQKK